MFSFSITAIAFGVVFLAELPDKTALAGLMLGTQHRAPYVFGKVRRLLPYTSHSPSPQAASSRCSRTGSSRPSSASCSSWARPCCS
ncbi:hypothetical protein SAVIM40S_02040 [Streptomyces avidinii]